MIRVHADEACPQAQPRDFRELDPAITNLALSHAAFVPVVEVANVECPGGRCPLHNVGVVFEEEVPSPKTAASGSS